MIAKFSEAFRLLRRHLGLFSAIILTVWLPGNILLESVAYYVNATDDTNLLHTVRASMWIETIFGPIYVAALVYALFEIKHGRSVSYKEAMAVGFRKWGPLIGARFFAGMLIALGLVALVIPGIVLIVRYSLLDAVVVLERRNLVTNPRDRSAALTSGRRWQIFWAGMLFFPAFLAASLALNLPAALIEPLNIMPVQVLLDCVSDIIYAIIQIFIFLFYWEATSDERRTTSDAPPSGDPATLAASAP